jgi:SAM-dependent methyltransferase
MNRPAAPQRCIVCDISPHCSFRLANGTQLLRCPRCGLAWWAWPAFDPAAFYDRSYFRSTDVTAGYDDYASLEEGLRRTARRRLKRIGRMMASRAGGAGGRRLLDVGCGTGVFLDEARRAAWDVSGFEVSEYAAEEARRRSLPVTCAPIEAVRLEPATFDCVTFWDTIEHLRDPLGALCQAGRALRPGGILALSTGDVTSLCARLSGPRWHLLSLPEHLFFFSPRSLGELLARAGCRVSKVTREVNWVPVAYVVERLGKSFRGRPRRRLPALGSWLVPATLLDVLGVYAVRTATP